MATDNVMMELVCDHYYLESGADEECLESFGETQYWSGSCGLLNAREDDDDDGGGAIEDDETWFTSRRLIHKFTYHI